MTFKPAEKIPLAVPNLCGNEGIYLQQCVTDNFVSTVGPFVPKFENLVAQATKSPYVVATCTGTSALHLGLNVAGVTQNDLVIIPSYTFIASAHAVKYTGADPWIFDISSEDLGLDAALVEKALKSECETVDGIIRHKKTGQRVAAILCVWALGNPCDMDGIIRVARAFNIPVVVDAAGALGSIYNGRNIGELDVACSILSFNGNKIVTSGGGGAVLTKSEAFAKKIRHLATTARLSPSYIHDEIGYNYRMTNLEAAVGCAQIENLPSFIESKRKTQQAYTCIAQRFQQVGMFPYRVSDQPNYWFTGLVLPDAEMTEDIVKDLNDKNIDARPCWVPLHMQPKFKSYMHTPQPVSEGVYQRVVTLPCSTQITDQERDYIVDTVCGSLATLIGVAA